MLVGPTTETRVSVSTKKTFCNGGRLSTYLVYTENTNLEEQDFSDYRFRVSTLLLFKVFIWSTVGSKVIVMSQVPDNPHTGLLSGLYAPREICPLAQMNAKTVLPVSSTFLRWRTLNNACFCDKSLSLSTRE